MSEKPRLYKIGYLSDLLGVTNRTVRYYDQLGLLPHVKRSEGGVRLFDDEDVEIIKKIRYMQKEERLPLDLIKDRLFGPKEEVKKNNIAVVTDTTCGLTEVVCKEQNIFCIPLVIRLGDETFLEPECSPELFWKKSANLQIQPITAPPTEDDFVKKYLEIHKLGYKKIYSIHLAAVLSDTCTNAKKAAHKVADRIEVEVVDSRSAGPGHRSFVLSVAEAVQKEASAEEIDLLISKTIPLNYVVMVSRTIKHLFSNINISQMNPKQINIINKLFTFIPLMSFKGDSAELDIIGWYKHKNEALDVMLNTISEEIKKRGNYVNKIDIDYNYLYGEAIDIINSVKSLYPKAKITMQEGSLVFSSYLGPETIAISIS
ncbi:DegV family protein [Candidatus Margulisiibacteriota bacterium]